MTEFRKQLERSEHYRIGRRYLLDAAYSDTELSEESLRAWLDDIRRQIDGLTKWLDRKHDG